MFPVLRRVRVRRWAPLLALALGLAGSSVGALAGQPSSWWWFAGGAVCAVVIAVMVALRRSARARRRTEDRVRVC